MLRGRGGWRVYRELRTEVNARESSAHEDTDTTHSIIIWGGLDICCWLDVEEFAASACWEQYLEEPKASVPYGDPEAQDAPGRMLQVHHVERKHRRVSLFGKPDKAVDVRRHFERKREGRNI